MWKHILSSFLLLIVLAVGVFYLASPNVLYSAEDDDSPFDCVLVTEGEPPTWEWCQQNARDDFEDCIEEPGTGCDYVEPYGGEEWCNCVNNCLIEWNGDKRGCDCHFLQGENCGGAGNGGGGGRIGRDIGI